MILYWVCLSWIFFSLLLGSAVGRAIRDADSPVPDHVPDAWTDANEEWFWDGER